jgi:PAS domain S-box-containing protein
MQLNIESVKFKTDTMLVSQTDIKGKIIYANVDFCKTAGYSFEELIGKPHNIIRHEDMPKVIFKYLWQVLQNGKSLYAFVKNKKKGGGHYWVKAYVSPIIKNGRIDSYTSYRTLIEDESSIQKVKNLYGILIEYEKTHSVDESLNFFVNYLQERNLTYPHLVVRLTEGKQVSNKSSLSIDVRSYFDDHVIFRTHIVRQIALKMQNVKVTKPCCCRFGKWLETIRGEGYTKHSEFRNVLTAHDGVHNKLQQYVDIAKNGASATDLNRLIDSIKEDTHTIFDTLQQVIDEYED